MDKKPVYILIKEEIEVNGKTYTTIEGVFGSKELAEEAKARQTKELCTEYLIETHELLTN